MAAVGQSIRVFVCLEAEPKLPHRAGKACDNPVCRHLDPPSIQNSCLDSVHREFAPARRVSSRGRPHQGLRLSHVDNSMRRGGSVMSGVSPPAPQPAANARRLAQPRTRPRWPRWPLRWFAANQNIRANHKLATQVSLSVIPQFSPQIQSTFASTIQERIPPCNRPQFCKSASTQKKGRHTTCNQGSPNQPPPDCPDSPSACSLLKPAAPHHFLSPFNSLPHPAISALPHFSPPSITTTTKIIAIIINNGSHQADRPQVHRWQGPA